jgi:HK97 gp10 family phage protein
VHLIERLLEHFAPAGVTSAILRTYRETGGPGPLTVTIGASIALEDMEEVPDDEVDGIEEDIHEILENTMLRVVEEAKSIVPVRTGLLRDSIEGKSDDEALMITFTADTDYAVFVEYGTSHMPARPFLVPTARLSEPELETEIEDAIVSHLDGNVDGDEENVDLEIETTYEGFSELQLAELAVIAG